MCMCVRALGRPPRTRRRRWETGQVFTCEGRHQTRRCRHKQAVQRRDNGEGTAGREANTDCIGKLSFTLETAKAEQLGNKGSAIKSESMN